MLHASCLCYTGHCSHCGKARSAAYAANLFTAADGMRFTRGAELLRSYKLPEAERFTQAFRRVCGGKMPRFVAERGVAAIPMGALDGDPGFRPQSHIFVASPAPWFAIAADLTQDAEYPA